jgi:hypothetical protein
MGRCRAVYPAYILPIRSTASAVESQKTNSSKLGPEQIFMINHDRISEVVHGVDFALSQISDLADPRGPRRKLIAGRAA